MNRLLSVVPIIIPSDPSVWAEVAEELSSFGEGFLLGLFLFCVFSGIGACIRGVVRLVRFLKVRHQRKE